MQVVIVNDTGALRHAGCQLVMSAFRSKLARHGITLIGTIPIGTRNFSVHHELLRKADLVIVNGEGSIHHGNHLELLEIASNYPSCLLNCVYQANPKIEALGQFLYVAARESLSVAALAEHDVRADLVPDVALAAPELIDFRRGAVDHGSLGIGDNVTRPDLGFSIRIGRGRAREYLQTLSSFRQLCVGRFHAAIMAASLEIPFSAWASNTHKTQGLLIDMGIPECFAPDFETAVTRVPKSFPDCVCQYVSEARSKIDDMFATLRQLLR
jgi:hypothetical protein